MKLAVLSDVHSNIAALRAVTAHLEAWGPDQVIEDLRPFVEQYGMTHLICRLFFPGMPHRHIMRALELIAREVRPAFS